MFVENIVYGVLVKCKNFSTAGQRIFLIVGVGGIGLKNRDPGLGRPDGSSFQYQFSFFLVRSGGILKAVAMPGAR